MKKQTPAKKAQQPAAKKTKAGKNAPAEKRATKTAETSAINPRWKTPALLVPIDVQALVVTNASLNLAWACNALEYSLTDTFTDVVPSMFRDTEQSRPKTGITMHWAVPDGITHGTEKDDGSIVYPFLPNRWMITRIWKDSLKGDQTKSWVVQSDFLDMKEGANEFLNPNSTTPTYTRIGKTWLKATWPGESGVTGQHFLTAIGPGSTTFTAYSPGNKSVFSFYDDMSEIPETKVPVTYFIAGWYADPEDDPMLGKIKYGPDGFKTLDEWKALLLSYGWTVGNDTDLEQAINDWEAWATAEGFTIDRNKLRDIVPSQTICQGMVYAVNWEGKSGKLQSGVPFYPVDTPKNKMPMVAVGNSSIDALAALVKYELEVSGTSPGKAKSAAAFLEAFQYHQLKSFEGQEGEAALFQEIFQAWFGSQDGERVWYVYDPLKPDHPDLSDTIVADLNKINADEEQLDHNNRELLLARQNLFGLWWKNGKAATYGSRRQPPGITAEQWIVIKARIKDVALPEAMQQVTALENDHTRIISEIEALKVKIEGQLTGGLVLESNTGERFWNSNEPVIMVYGAHRSYRRGEDGRYDDQDLLFTRFTGQTVTGMNVELPDQQAVLINATNITIPVVPDLDDKFPPQVNNLAIETFFFDTTNAEAIARKATTLLGIPYQDSYKEDVIKQQTAAWNASVNNLDPQLVASLAGMVGVIPSKVAVDPWQAPWSPLYMAWDISWYPSYTETDNALEHWEYKTTNYEYEWDNRVKPDSGTPVSFSGSTLITPKGAFALEAELDAYLDATGKYKEMRDFLETTGNWDFLSQTISGWNDMLSGKNWNQLNMPDPDYLALIKEQTQLTPVPDEQINHFFPIRAGHFRINRLWIVDDFGQVFDPIAAAGQSPATFHPALGPGLETATDKTLIQMPPRITQPARLHFRFLPGEKGAALTDLSGKENPVCGWLLPNHLDRGLMLYSSDGEVLAEILLTGTTGNLKLRLDYAPGQNIPVGTPLAEVFTNEYLRGFVEGLFAQSDPARSFIALLEVIDETLWTVNPLGGRDSAYTAVLIGRPLALVRSGLSLELSGGKLYNEKWSDSGLKNSGGYETNLLPVQIGNRHNPQDGTIGFFAGKDFSVFSTLLQEQAMPDPYIVNKRLDLYPDNNEREAILLVDPRGSFTAVPLVLPLTELVLSTAYIEQPMANMQVTFRTGPLLTDPEQLRMPLPTEMNGAWSWIQHSGVTTWETMETIAQANQQPRFPETVGLRDGWLQLSGEFKPDSGE